MTVVQDQRRLDWQWRKETETRWSTDCKNKSESMHFVPSSRACGRGAACGSISMQQCGINMGSYTSSRVQLLLAAGVLPVSMYVYVD